MNKITIILITWTNWKSIIFPCSNSSMCSNFKSRKKPHPASPPRVRYLPLYSAKMVCRWKFQVQMEAGTTKDVWSLLNVDIDIMCRFRCRESLRLFKTLAPLNSMSPATNKLAYIIFGFPQVWPLGYTKNVGIMVPRTPLILGDMHFHKHYSFAKVWLTAPRTLKTVSPL